MCRFPMTVTVLRKAGTQNYTAQIEVSVGHHDYNKATWKRRMIPDIRKWMNQPRLGTALYNFHIVRALSGHGFYQNCTICGKGVAGLIFAVTTVQRSRMAHSGTHSLFNCPYCRADSSGEMKLYVNFGSKTPRISFWT